MDWIVIEGVKPYDGRYQFDIEDQPLSRREWGWIKRLSGYLPLTIGEGYGGGDPELYVVFAIIALYRAGKVDPAAVQALSERFADIPFDDIIRFEGDTEAAKGDDAGPPPSSSNGSEPSSGAGSPTSSESSAQTLPAAGIPGSDISVSVPATSAS